MISVLIACLCIFISYSYLAFLWFLLDRNSAVQKVSMNKVLYISQESILKKQNLPPSAEIVDIAYNVPRSKGGAILHDRFIKVVYSLVPDGPVTEPVVKKTPWYARFFRSN